jgi:plastocyanin
LATVLLIGVGSGSGLSGCGDDGPRLVVQSAAAPVTAATEPTVVTVTPTGVVVQITALDNSFRPQSIEINIGDEVVWENRGRNEHNVLRVEGDGWGVEAPSFQPGDRYGFVFSEPGEYDYFCSIHGNEQAGMTGTIIVSA